MALGDFGVIVSPNTVARLLHQMGYSLRVNHKQLSSDQSPDRNDQFLYLGDLRDQFQRRGLPIISVDTKKRELVGNFKNPGTRWDLSARRVNDHDFRFLVSTLKMCIRDRGHIVQAFAMRRALRQPLAVLPKLLHEDRQRDHRRKLRLQGRTA